MRVDARSRRVSDAARGVWCLRPRLKQREVTGEVGAFGCSPVGLPPLPPYQPVRWHTRVPDGLAGEPIPWQVARPHSHPPPPTSWRTTGP